MNCKGGPCLVGVLKIFQGRHWMVNHHRGRSQAYKTSRGHYSFEIGNACCCVLLHPCRHHCGHGSPCQKAWWSCQFQWEVNSCTQGVISPLGPGYFSKTGQWHLPVCNGAAQWCFHSLGEDILCTSPLAGNSQGVCCWGNGDLRTSYASGGTHASCRSPAVPTVTVFPRGQRLDLSVDLEGVTHTQFEGSTGSNTWASVKVVNGSIHSLNSLMHSASWCGSPGGVGLARSAQCCRALAYAKFFGVVSSDNPASWTSHPSVGGRHHGPGNVGCGAV